MSESIPWSIFYIILVSVSFLLPMILIVFPFSFFAGRKNTGLTLIVAFTIYIISFQIMFGDAESIYSLMMDAEAIILMVLLGYIGYFVFSLYRSTESYRIGALESLALGIILGLEGSSIGMSLIGMMADNMSYVTVMSLVITGFLIYVAVSLVSWLVTSYVIFAQQKTLGMVFALLSALPVISHLKVYIEYYNRH